MRKITLIDIHPSGDGYQLIFIDGELFMQGDDYHDKILDNLVGIKNYLNFCGEPYEEESCELEPKKSGKYWFDLNYAPKEGENLEAYLKRAGKQFTIE